MNIRKLLFVILLISLVFSIFCTNVYGAGDVDSIISGMEGYDTNPDTNKITDGINSIYTLVRIVGTGIAVLMVIIVSIRYMITSVESKAEIKKQAIPLLVGAFLIFAASNILGIVGDFVLG